MNNENEFEFCGNHYKAAEVPLSNGCKDCGIWSSSHGCSANLFPDGKVPDCDPDYRSDGLNVIFLEKKQ